MVVRVDMEEFLAKVQKVGSAVKPVFVVEMDQLEVMERKA